jgi:YggT family protein
MAIICLALQLFLYIMFARVIFSYFPITPGSVFESINNFLRMVTDPILVPLRRVLPPVRMGGMGIDLSPMVVFFGIIIIRPIIGC